LRDLRLGQIEVEGGQRARSWDRLGLHRAVL
jgi:hypothetical protein